MQTRPLCFFDSSQFVWDSATVFLPQGSTQMVSIRPLERYEPMGCNQIPCPLAAKTKEDVKKKQSAISDGVRYQAIHYEIVLTNVCEVNNRSIMMLNAKVRSKVR